MQKSVTVPSASRSGLTTSADSVIWSSAWKIGKDGAVDPTGP